MAATTTTPRHHGRMPDPADIVECGTCQGDGELLDEFDCRECGGAGEIDDADGEPERCDECHGDGTVQEHEPCMSCNGDGHDRYDDWFVRDVAKVLDRLHADGFEVMLGTLCCLSCSFAAATTEGRDEHGNPKPGYVPFVGFHEQDLGGALSRPEAGIHLFHDATEDDAARIVAAFVAAGYDVEWDGSHGKRIHVTAE